MAEFDEAGEAEVKFEVLVRADNYNQTAVESCFIIKSWLRRGEDGEEEDNGEDEEEDNEQIDKILRVLQDAEEEGEIDFAFTVIRNQYPR